MSTRTRSNALRKILAETIEQSAATPAPLTITGVGASPEESPSNAEGSLTEVMTPDSRLITTDLAGSLTTIDKEPVTIQVSRIGRGPARSLTPPAARQTQNESLMPPARTGSPRPTGEKLSVLLGPRDLAILERFHEDARGAGIKMRKGGNPSLFVRAALRLLEDVGARNADDWAQIVAATLREAR